MGSVPRILVSDLAAESELRRAAGNPWFLSAALGRMRRSAPLLIALIPVLFTVYTWAISDGIPYFTDGNETYSAYAHARNMYRFAPLANSLLTDDAVGHHPQAHPFTYTHQGNLPRYFSYLFLVAGIRSIEFQVLLAAVLSIGLSFWFAYRTFGGRLTLSSLFVLAFLALDFLGVLQWYGNLYRTWHFPLFFGTLMCARERRWKPLAFVCVFLLFQMEFTFAVFTTASALGLLLISGSRRGARSTAFAMSAGAVVSVTLFLFQLISFLGVKGFLFDLTTTYRARDSTAVQWAQIREFYEAHNLVMWPSFSTTNHGFGPFITVTNTYGQLMYGRLWELALAGLAFSLVIHCGRILAPRWFYGRGVFAALARSDSRMGQYLHPMVGAYLLLGLIMSGYTLTGYTQRWGPMLGFPVMMALLSLARNTATSVRLALKSVPPLRRFQSRTAASVAIGACACFVVLLSAQSAAAYGRYPPFRHEPRPLLSTKYAGKSFVSNTTYPHMIASHTGKWAYYSPLVFPPDEKLDQTYNWNADRFTNAEYMKPEYYLCQTVPYRKDVNCESIAREMESLGHRLTDLGATFAILKLNWRHPASRP